MSKKTLLIYSTVEGQTQAIIKKIAEHLPADSFDLYNVDDVLGLALDNYETILVGGSIRYGHFRKPLMQFILQNTSLLNAKKTAFFCVCVTARKEGKDTPEGSAYTRKLFAKVAWQPNLKAVFAGALYYPRYNWFDRTMIRFIMRMGGEKDHKMTENYSYTDWHKVDNFAEQFVQLVSA